MNARRDPDRLIHAFLMEGPTDLADQVYDAVRATIEQKRQRVVVGPWRTPIMNKFVPIGLGAVAVVVALVVGTRLLGPPAPAEVGGPAVTPSSTPEASSADSTSTPGASPAASRMDFAAQPIGRLEAGDYVFTHLPGLRVIFTASSNWEKNPPNWIIWSIDDNKATMGLSTVRDVAIDPCQPDRAYQDPPVGPTVDDLVTALGAVPGVTFSAPIDVTLDGYSGVRLDYVPPDNFDNCLDDMGEATLMRVDHSVPANHAELAAPSGADAFSVYIYDVDGTRVVITAAYTENRAQELDEMLASIRFEQP